MSQGNKLTQEYEVYSQKFQKEDFGDDEPFDPKVLPNEYLTSPNSTHTFVYVSTIQRMARNLFGAEASFPQAGGDAEAEAEADKLDIPIHAFDLIIADECHRGYTLQETSLWRDTIGYFDAVKIGLTATPAPHTTALFGQPVFRYDVEQAILNGFLVDYEAVAIKSEVRMNGAFLKEGEEVGYIDTVTGKEHRDELEDERAFASEEIEKSITAPQSNRKINKTKFVVFDCFDGTLIQYFKNTTDFEIQPPTKAPLTLPEIIENIWQNVDRDYHVRILAKRLRRMEKDMGGEARTEFAKWIPDGDIGAFASQLPQNIKSDFTGTMKLLRNEEFQKLLLEYQRAYVPFLVGYEVQDTVSSKKLDRFGKYDTAEGYLDAFSRFVKENADKVDALGILLKRPRDWRPKALEELRRTLAQNQFDERKLQDAHRVASHKALADVISIVKHAATAQAPVLTAEERVSRALDALTAKHRFTTEQMQWLSLVREQLIKNLTIDEEDFDNTPLLQGRGGVARARQVFGELDLLVAQLNEAVAA